jgi:hypothetical protein
MTNVTDLNEHESRVSLFYAQRRALASVLEAFTGALRDFGPIRQGDFDDAIKEIARYRESPCPCGKPRVPGLTSPLCAAHSIVD